MMTAIWTGEAFEPVLRFRKSCDEKFIVGEQYFIEPTQERSIKSHRHYFASVNEAWRNLPDDAAERFLTPEHLRKYALIQAGFCDERTFVCASKAETLRLCAFLRGFDEYAIIDARECAVRVRTAKSQSIKAMGAQDFRKSKEAVLDILSAMLGVDADALVRNAGKAA